MHYVSSNKGLDRRIKNERCTMINPSLVRSPELVHAIGSRYWERKARVPARTPSEKSQPEERAQGPLGTQNTYPGPSNRKPRAPQNLTEETRERWEVDTPGATNVSETKPLSICGRTGT